MEGDGVHPLVHIFLPSSLQPRAQGRGNKKELLLLLGLVQRSRTPEGSLLLQISLTGLLQEEGKTTPPLRQGDGQLGVIGALISGSREPGPPPSWALTESPSTFITLRVREEEEGVRVERLLLDTTVLPPNPSRLILFSYQPQLLTRAEHLRRNVRELESGLPGILRESVDVGVPEGLRGGESLLPPPLGVEEVRRKDPFGRFWKEEEEEKFPFDKSVGLKQFGLRVSQWNKLVRGEFSSLSALNLVLLMVLDSVLGLLFSHFLNQFPNLYGTLDQEVDYLLSFLARILNWLKGSPAGLKLNAALNSLLWRFFSYHLHLWGNYIGILEPVLTFLLSAVIHVGALGFTMQLALVKDLVSIATFHVYCLYIYATRLYRVLLTTVTSLGRLFLGRKWNPLRQRVDHVQLSISEMFLSALLFTISVFLAPTVITYYIVFLSLRLPVILLESFLRVSLQTLNSCHIVTFLLAWANQPGVCDQIYLEKVSQDLPLHFSLCFNASRVRLWMSSVDFSLVKVIRNIVQGHVIN